MNRRKVTLPDVPRLSVNVFTGTVHLPYATHAGAHRRSTPAGVMRLLDGRAPALCRVCWPKGKP